jgi:hypothetical protein
VIEINQQIGIQFTATGADKVVAAVKEIKDQLTQLQGFMKSLNAGDMGKMATSLTEVAKSFTNISNAASGIQRTAGAVLTLASATETLVRAQAGLRKFSDAVGPAPSAAAGGRGGPPIATVHGGQNYRSGDIPRSRAMTLWSPPYQPPPNWYEPPPRRLALPSGSQTTGPMGAYSNYWSNPGGNTQGMRRNWRGVWVPTGEPPFSAGSTGGGGGTPEIRRPRRPGGGSGDGFGDSLGKKIGTVAGYSLATAGVYGIYRLVKAGVTDILGEGALESLMDARSRLFAEGLKWPEIQAIEAEGRRSTRDKPWFSTNDYGRAYAEGMGYFPRQTPDVYRTFADSSMRIAKRGQLKDTFKAGQILGDLSTLQMNHIDPRLLTPQKRVEILKNTQKAIELATRDNPLWLTQIGDYTKYAAPAMLDQGMKIDEILAWAGAMKPGFRPSTLGRGTKRWFTREPENIAQLLLASEKQIHSPNMLEATGHKVSKKERNKYKKLLGDETNKLRWEIEKDPLSILGRVYQGYQHLRDQGRQNPFADAKMSLNFDPIYRSMIKPAVGETVKSNLADWRGITVDQLNAEDSKNVGKMSTGMQRLSASLSRWSEAASTAYGVGEAFTSASKMMDKWTEHLDKDTKDRLELQKQEKLVASYDKASHVTPEKLREMGPGQRRQYLLGLEGAGADTEMMYKRYRETMSWKDYLTIAPNYNPQNMRREMWPVLHPETQMPTAANNLFALNGDINPFGPINSLEGFKNPFPTPTTAPINASSASTGDFVESLGSATTAVGSFATAVITAISKISSASPVSPDAPEKKPGPVAGNK